MRTLILLGLAALVVAPLQAQQHTRSPHGELKMECANCHGGNGWTPVRIAKTFDHSKLGFALAGLMAPPAAGPATKPGFQGRQVGLRLLHADRHRGELGANCARCHTARSFLDRDVMTKATS